MTKAERFEHLKDLVVTLTGTEFHDDGSLKTPNAQLIRRIQANARLTYLTDSGRLSNIKNLMAVNQFPIINFEVIEQDELYRILYAVLHVNVNGKDCQIPIVDI